MPLSQQVEDSLREAEANLRNALAFAARQERPIMCKTISETIFKIDNIIKTDEILDNLDERIEGDSGQHPPFFHDGRKKMRIDGVEERVKAYGWHCDGNDIVGHYVTTENYQLTYNMEGIFTKMVPIRELAHSSR